MDAFDPEHFYTHQWLKKCYPSHLGSTPSLNLNNKLYELVREMKSFGVKPKGDLDEHKLDRWTRQINELTKAGYKVQFLERFIEDLRKQVIATNLEVQKIEKTKADLQKQLGQKEEELKAKKRYLDSSKLALSSFQAKQFNLGRLIGQYDRHVTALANPEDEIKHQEENNPEYIAKFYFNPKVIQVKQVTSSSQMNSKTTDQINSRSAKQKATEGMSEQDFNMATTDFSEGTRRSTRIAVQKQKAMQLRSERPWKE